MSYLKRITEAATNVNTAPIKTAVTTDEVKSKFFTIIAPSAQNDDAPPCKKRDIEGGGDTLSLTYLTPTLMIVQLGRIITITLIFCFLIISILV